MMAVVGEVLRATSLDILDIVIVTAISDVNTQPKPVPTRAGRAPLSAVPGISRNAISRAMNIPLETVRRRVAALLDKGVLYEQSDGLVFAQNNTLGIGNNGALLAFNLEKLRELFRALKDAGIAME